MKGEGQIPNQNKNSRPAAATGKQNQRTVCSLKARSQQGVLKLYEVVCDVSIAVLLWPELHVCIFQAAVLIDWLSWSQVNGPQLCLLPFEAWSVGVPVRLQGGDRLSREGEETSIPRGSSTPTTHYVCFSQASTSPAPHPHMYQVLALVGGCLERKMWSLFLSCNKRSNVKWSFTFTSVLLHL